jgi:hypothetical protein
VCRSRLLDTDGVNQNLTQDFAKAIYNDTPELKTAEITGRKGDMQINPDGTKTMEVGGKKMMLVCKLRLLG